MEGGWQSEDQDEDAENDGDDEEDDHDTDEAADDEAGFESSLGGPDAVAKPDSPTKTKDDKAKEKTARMKKLQI